MRGFDAGPGPWQPMATEAPGHASHLLPSPKTKKHTFACLPARLPVCPAALAGRCGVSGAQVSAPQDSGGGVPRQGDWHHHRWVGWVHSMHSRAGWSGLAGGRAGEGTCLPTRLVGGPGGIPAAAASLAGRQAGWSWCPVCVTQPSPGAAPTYPSPSCWCRQPCSQHGAVEHQQQTAGVELGKRPLCHHWQ
jgi:hypothetical protein